MLFHGVHHIAIICSDYEVSKHFYTKILKFRIIRENYRHERKSYKLDLQVSGNIQIELFSFESPPKRTSNPEACGLRHLAFSVKDIASALKHLENNHIKYEEIRIDEYTGKRFTFFKDPDGLPLELYEES